MEWHDPFAEDEAGRERERRRAEREARRRERRESLADKVSAERAAAQPEPERRPEPSERPARPATAPTRPARTEPAPPSANRLLQRRIAGLVLVAGVLGLLAFGFAKVVDRLGGEDEIPARPAAAVKVGTVTIPEGFDRRQIAEVAEEAGLRGDYVAESRSFKGFDPGKYGAEEPESLEGFLFPATYELEKEAKVEALVSRQLDALEQNLREVDFSYAESKNLNVYDVLKIASMVEREVQVPEERKLVAAVIYNRLAAGSPLGIDATIRYEDQNYDEQLTESRLAEDTPYNTRVNAGLPPTPIGNPGLASIEAAANPAQSDAFFFVVKPGTCGEHVFVETEEEFAAAEAEYQAALEAEGGSPTEC